MESGDLIVLAARDMIGAPFRLHGRNADTGLDCVGLVVRALEAAGCERAIASVPAGYRMNGGYLPLYVGCFRMAGLVAVEDDAAGDIVLTRAAPAQFHLMIATGAGHVHAHAGLRRVVEMPGPSPWPILGRWRWARALNIRGKEC